MAIQHSSLDSIVIDGVGPTELEVIRAPAPQVPAHASDEAENVGSRLEGRLMSLAGVSRWSDIDRLVELWGRVAFW